MRSTQDCIAVVVAVFLLAFVATKCHAETDPPGPEQIGNLYAIAIGLTGQGVPEKPPAVYRISEEAMCELVNRPYPCGLKGMQAADSVFFSNDLDFTKPLDSSALLHEFVHYVQRERIVNGKKAGRAKDAFERRVRECQAYKVQGEALSKIGINFMPPKEYCDE